MKAIALLRFFVVPSLALLIAACPDDSANDTKDTTTADTTDATGGDTTAGDTAVADTGAEDTTAVADTSTTDTAVADTSTADTTEPGLALNVILTPEQEVPAATATCTDGICGTATVTINAARDAVDVSLTLDAGVTSPTAAHLHLGAPGENGPVILALTTPTAGGTTASSLDTGDVQNAASFADVLNALETGRTYLNVHNAAFPGGVVRGHVGGVALGVALSGAQENPPVDSALSGTAIVAIARDHQSADVTITIDGDASAFTAGHIHGGALGQNGGVLVPLYSAAADGTFASPYTVTVDLTDATVTALLAGAAYLNLHSAAHPGGEIRGQIGVIHARSTLSGDQEVPRVDSDGSGAATLTVNGPHNAIRVTLDTDGLTGVTAAHIHGARVGVNGGVVLALGGPPADPFDETFLGEDLSSGTMTAFIDQIASGNAYFNVHTGAHPGGEIRGQVGRVVLRAHLSGLQEPTPVDSDGSGTAVVTIGPSGDVIHVALSVGGLTGVTAAHIHAGGPGVNGGVLFPLASAEFTDHTVTLTEADLGSGTMAEAIDDILAGLTYVNVHTTANSGGEIRGQLGRIDFSASLDGAQEDPAVVTLASGSGTVRVDGEQQAISVNVTFTGLVSPTASHIHHAATGTNGPVIFSLQSSPTSPIAVTLAADDLSPDAAGGIETFGDALGALVSRQTYINIHTPLNTSGEIRGQIVAD